MNTNLSSKQAQKMTKEKFWFKMGQTAFLEGLSIEEAMPYGSDTFMFVQFCAGWQYEKMKAVTPS